MDKKHQGQSHRLLIKVSKDHPTDWTGELYMVMKYSTKNSRRLFSMITQLVGAWHAKIH